MAQTINNVHNAQLSTSSNVQSTQDTINNGIIENLSRASQEYFGTLESVPVGTYTAKDICDMQKKGKLILNDCNIHTCKVGTFECSFPVEMIFHVLHQYEKIFKVSAAKRVKFTQSKQVKAASEFIITFPKATKELTKHVGKDTYRPVLCGVCIDTANSALVATDTKVLSEVRAQVDVCSGEHCQILIDAKIAKAIAGKSAIVEVGEDGKAVITAESGETYEGKTTRNYPDYRRVLPNVSREGYIKFGKDAIKEFTKFCKLNGGKIDMHIVKGNTGVTLKSYMDDDGKMKLKAVTTLLLESAAQCDGVLMFNTEVFNKVAQWDGGIWLTNSTLPIVFDCKGIEYTVIMPWQGTRIDISGEVKPCMERGTAVAENSQVIAENVTDETMADVTEVAIAENVEIECKITYGIADKFVKWHNISGSELLELCRYADIRINGNLKRKIENNISYVRIIYKNGASNIVGYKLRTNTILAVGRIVYELYTKLKADRVPIDSVIKVEKSELTPEPAPPLAQLGEPPRHNAIFRRNGGVSFSGREIYHPSVCVAYRANMTQISKEIMQGRIIEVVGTRARGSSG